jgi:hypothetical protein
VSADIFPKMNEVSLPVQKQYQHLLPMRKFELLSKNENMRNLPSTIETLTAPHDLKLC